MFSLPERSQERLPPIAPDDLTDAQRVLHDEISALFSERFATGFDSKREDGALIGPFAPLLHHPAWGTGAWAQIKALLGTSVLPKPAHEVAILVVGAALGARYELYAHQRIAHGAALDDAKAATIVAGQRPADLSDEEAVAYDVAAALVRGGALPDATYGRAVDVVGADGAIELVFLVGGYQFVSTILNGFDVPVPTG